MNCKVCDHVVYHHGNLDALDGDPPVRLWHCPHCGTLYPGREYSPHVPELAVQKYPRTAAAAITGMPGWEFDREDASGGDDA